MTHERDLKLSYRDLIHIKMGEIFEDLGWDDEQPDVEAAVDAVFDATPEFAADVDKPVHPDHCDKYGLVQRGKMHAVCMGFRTRDGEVVGNVRIHSKLDTLDALQTTIDAAASYKECLTSMEMPQ